MAKKKYKVSDIPKVAQTNEYIYTQLEKPKLVGPKMKRKDYKMRNVKVVQGKRVPYSAKEPSFLSTNTITEQKRLSKGLSKKPVGTPQISQEKTRKARKSQIKAGIGIGQPEPSAYKVAPSESQLPVERQKIKSYTKPKGEIGGYKYGANSPINLAKASKRLSPAAKRAIITGAKVASKGATRLIPVVGQVMIAKDVYDANKWATSQPKKKKTKMKLYGTSINKSYKYNR